MSAALKQTTGKTTAADDSSAGQQVTDTKPDEHTSLQDVTTEGLFSNVCRLEDESPHTDTVSGIKDDNQTVSDDDTTPYLHGRDVQTEE